MSYEPVPLRESNLARVEGILTGQITSDVKIEDVQFMQIYHHWAARNAGLIDMEPTVALHRLLKQPFYERFVNTAIYNTHGKVMGEKGFDVADAQQIQENINLLGDFRTLNYFDPGVHLGGILWKQFSSVFDIDPNLLAVPAFYLRYSTKIAKFQFQTVVEELGPTINKIYWQRGLEEDVDGWVVETNIPARSIESIGDQLNTRTGTLRVIPYMWGDLQALRFYRAFNKGEKWELD